MTFEEYEKKAFKTAQYPHIGQNLIYPALGLVGEAGEVAEKIKKIWRNKNVWFANENESDELVMELGDVLWYINALAHELGYPLHIIAERNLLKLEDRAVRNVIKSSGDNR
jgi:NTP pyrophosphatase (non-canonical NTP hydrolase)